MTTERWRAVSEYPYHEISTLGRVRSTARRVWFTSKRGDRFQRRKAAKVLTPQKINSGYLVVHMWIDGVRIVRTVHSLVALAFYGPRPDGREVAHRDGDRVNNRADNLRYLTRRENHAEKKIHGTALQGEQALFSKLTTAEVRHLRTLTDTPVRVLAAQFGVSRSQIYRIRARENWAHV